MIPLAFRTTRTNRGVTLAELLLAVTIIAILGSLALPNLNSAESLRVDNASAQLRAAFDFARTESIRTGEPHSVELNSVSNTVLVLKIEDFGALSLQPPLVRHPLTKQAYQLDFDDHPSTAPTTLTASSFIFDTIGNRSRVDFSDSGQPIHTDLLNQAHRLTNTNIQLSARGRVQELVLDPITGWVSGL